MAPSEVFDWAQECPEYAPAPQPREVVYARANALSARFDAA